MFPGRYLLAFSLLTAPPDIQLPSAGATASCPALKATLQQLAVDCEILDPREVRYVLNRPEEFNTDLALLRRRQQELADAPPLADGDRFPDRATINELLSFNRAYRQPIDVRQSMEPANWWALQKTLQETDSLYQLWDTVRDARCEYYYVSVRRQALKKLRQEVGGEAYYNGQLPPHVPLWRFRMVNP
jgi:hypothetical protein